MTQTCNAIERTSAKQLAGTASIVFLKIGTEKENVLIVYYLM